MICKNCSSENPDTNTFCSNCDTELTEVYEHDSADTPDCTQEQEASTQENTDQNSHISPWVYAGYYFLYAIPIAGLILLIIFSLSNKDIGRRNFARAYWCVLLIFLSYISMALPYFIMLYIQKHI